MEAGLFFERRSARVLMDSQKKAKKAEKRKRFQEECRLSIHRIVTDDKLFSTFM